MRGPHRAAGTSSRVRVAWLAALALVAVLVPACTVGPPPVCDVTWVGPASGVWSDPGNWGSPGGWTAGALPGPTHRACAPAGTAITVDAPVTVGSFDVDTLTVPADQTLSIAHDAHATTLQVAGTVTGTGTLTGGTLELTGGTLAGNITTFFTTATTLAGGTITDTARALLGTGLTWTSPLQACGTAAVHTYATTTLTVPAALTTTGCPGTPAPTLTIAATGRLTLAAPFTSDVPVTTTGTLTLDHTTLTTPALTLTTTGALTGTGTLAGDLTGAGAVEPGDPTTPGDLHLTGTYTPTPGATIAIDLTGPAPSTHDTLTIDGTADLTPTTYTARTSPTFAPHARDTFPTITATTLTGPPAATTTDPGLILDTTPTAATLRTCNPDDPADTPHCPTYHLGTTGPTFGNQIDPATCPQYSPTATPPCGPQPFYWASITGPYALYTGGDPYATKCAPGGGSGTTCTQPNPSYRATGYDYAIDVAPTDVGHPLTVVTYDIGSYQRTVTIDRLALADCNTGYDPYNVGQYSRIVPLHCQTGDSGDPQNVDVQLHEPDAAGRADTTSAIPACHQLALATDTTNAFKNTWADVCTFTPTRSGQHDLRVRNSELPGLGDTGSGLNQFALRLTGGTQSTVYPIHDGSTLVSSRSSTTATPVAHIPRWYAGRTLDIDVYDPGDNNQQNDTFLQVRGPGLASIPAVGIATGCSYNAVANPTPGPLTDTSSSTCQVNTRTGTTSRYDGGWLRVRVTLDVDYTCAQDCTWTLLQTFLSGTAPWDRTTWSVDVHP